MAGLNDSKLIADGAFDFGNSDFNLMVTTCCEKIILVECEVGHLYINPDDLSQSYLEFDIVDCPICKNSNFGFKNIEDIQGLTGWEKYY